MLAKMFSVGIDVATLPARLGLRSARAMTMSAAELQQFTEELRQASEATLRELQTVVAGVDDEMRFKAGHLSPEQKAQAAGLALEAAEQHLSMAAVNLLRALWLSAHAGRELADQRRGEIIDHEGPA